MTVVSGELVVRLPGESQWRGHPTASEFIAETDQRFQLIVATDTAYLCTYG